MKKILGFIAVLVIGLIVVGLLLPNHFEVKRSIVVNAEPAKIHQLVNDLQQWPVWAPWQAADPTIVTQVGAITQGVGASQSWQGDSGAGSLLFTVSNENTGIVYDLNFDGDPSSYSASVTYTLLDSGQTEVVWSMQGEMQPIIIGNYFAQLMDFFVGEMFAQGLANLKAAVEK